MGGNPAKHSKRWIALEVIRTEWAKHGKDTQASMRAFIENRVSRAARDEAASLGLRHYEKPKNPCPWPKNPCPWPPKKNVSRTVAGQKHDLFKRSTDYVRREHFEGRITADDAVRALQEKERQIRSRPGSRSKEGSFYKLTPGARKRVDAISRSVQQIMAIEKKAVRQNVSRGAVEKAVRLSRRFHGLRPRRLSNVRITWPKALVLIGQVVRLDYLSDKEDGKPRIYTHDFDRPAQVFASGSAKSGQKNILLLHGKFTITQEGIVG